MRFKKMGNRLIAALVMGAMVSAVFVPGAMYAAKKVTLNKTKCTVKKGEVFKIKVKNGNKKGKIKWSSNKPSIVKIAAKSTNGKKGYARLKALKKGKATITALYTYAGKKNRLKCSVVVKVNKLKDKISDKNTEQNAQTVTATPATSPTAVLATATPAPTAEPTVTPVPTATPIPFANLVEVSDLEEIKTAPDIFTYIDGTPVTAENWSGRAEEIRQMYQYYMYGMWRDGEGETLTYSIDGKKMDINIETSGVVTGQKEGASSSFNVEVNIPEGNAPEGGWPVIIALGSLSEMEYALSNGYAVINYDVGQVSTDSAERKGAFYTLYPYNMSEWREQTGVLMAWAWGASKVLDALNGGAAADFGINSEYAIVGGVSRYGKATAIAGAFDTRFKIALPTCSGSGGMGVFRYNPDAQVTQEYDVSSLGYMSKVTYKQGDVETIGSLQSSGEAFWFNQRFLEFRSIYKLPFDQYFLSALFAQEGRTLMLIGGFNFDVWQNTPGLWYNFQKAKPVFDMLGLSNNIIINLHDAAMGHNILNDDVVKLFAYCNEMYNGVDVENFEISDLQTTLFELEETPSGINNKEVYEAQIPE